MKRIPLHARDGSIRAYALVDDADYDALAPYRWSLSDGYVVRRVPGGGGKQIRMHRQVCGLQSGDSRQADHKDGDPLNNQRENLRVGTLALNQQNRVRIDRRNTSGFRGVSWNKRRRRWIAQVKLNRRNHYVGAYDTAAEAGAAAAAFRALHMPFSPESSHA